MAVHGILGLPVWCMSWVFTLLPLPPSLIGLLTPWTLSKIIPSIPKTRNIWHTVSEQLNMWCVNTPVFSQESTAPTFVVFGCPTSPLLPWRWQWQEDEVLLGCTSPHAWKRCNWQAQRGLKNQPTPEMSHPHGSSDRQLNSLTSDSCFCKTVTVVILLAAEDK